MARFEKRKAHQLGELFNHYNRTPDDGVDRDNKDINNERTMFNYDLRTGTVNLLNERLKNVFHRGQKDEVKLIDAIVHLPLDVKPEDERKFFESVFQFFINDFGDENVIAASVHKDEKRPHIHIGIAPVKEGNFTYKQEGRYQDELNKWKATHEKMERLCCSEILTRAYYKSMHERLSNHVERDLGYKVEILNGATAGGNRTVLELKNQELEKQIEEKEKIVNHMENEVKKMFLLTRNLGIDAKDISLYPLIEKIAGLEKQCSILQDIIRKNGLRYSSEQLNQLRAAKTEIKSTPLTVRSGSMKDYEIDEKGIIVVEVQNYPDRVYTPQRPMFDAEPEGRFDLERPFRRFLASREEVWTAHSRQTENVYMFTKANDIQQLLNNLLEMQRLLNENEDLRNRKLYIEQFECDDYNFAKNVLEKSNHEVYYFVKSEQERHKQEQLEKEI